MLPVTPRPRNWSGVYVSIDVAATSLAPTFLVQVVALRIELSTTRVSAVSGPPALDYRSKSGTPESNREPPAPEAGVLPSAPLPVCLFQSERPRPIRRPCRSVPEPAVSWSPTWRDPRLRHVLIKYPVGESNPNPTGIRSPSADPLDRARCARTSSAVGWEVLESSSPALQTGATPSQLPTQTKKPGVFCDTGLW